MPIAIGAFVALDVFIIAIVLTLWALSTIVMLRPIIQFLANAANDIPYIGGWLARELHSIENYVSQWIQNTVNSAWRAGATPVYEMMNTYAHAKSGELYSQSIVNGVMYNGVAYAIAHATGVVNSPTQSYVTNSSTVNNTYVLANTDAAVAQSEAYTQTSYSGLAEWANNAVQELYHDVIDADGRVATLAQQTEAGLSEAHDYTDTSSATAEKNAVNLAGDYTLASFHTVEEYATQVRDYATAAVADTREWAEQEINTKTTEVADALDGKIAIVATVAAAAETAFADFMNNCGDPLCGGLTGLAKSFLGMKDLLGVGLMLGFLEEAIREPERTADATVAVADAITAPAKTIIGDVFGV